MKSKQVSRDRRALLESLETRILFADAGATLGTALNLGAISSQKVVAETLGGTDVADAFKFNITAASNVTTSINNGSVFQKLIWDKNSNNNIDSGEVLSQSWGGSQHQRLPIGSYFVMAEPDGTQSYNLTINVSATGVVDPSDKLSSATTLTLSGGVASKTEWVGNADGLDVYKFTLGTISNVNVSLNNGSTFQKLVWDKNGNFNIDSGEVLAQSWGGANHQRLPAGTYYVTVEPDGGSQNYTLNVNATAAPTDVPDNLNAAKSLSFSGSTASSTDWVGNADGIDVYKFTLGTISNVTVSLSNGSTFQKLVWDKNNNFNIDGGEVLAQSWGGANHQRLPAGTYYVTVEPDGGSQNYTLNINATTAVTDVPETLVDARQLNFTNGIASQVEWVGNADLLDAYKFTVDKISDVTVSLSNGSTFQKFIWDKNNNFQIDSGEVLAQSWGGANHQRVPAGTYYVTVEPDGGSQNYTLNINAKVAPDDVGDSLSAARNVGPIGGARIISEWVGNADAADFYMFTVPTTGNVTLSLNNGSVFGKLIKDTNGNKQIDSGEVVQQGWGYVATTSLTAGTYYFSVEPDGGSRFYDFTLNTNPSTGPKANVSGNGTYITDGDTTPSATDWTDFGSVALNGSLSRTFTVRNYGNSALTTSGLTVPSGFSITEGLSSSIAAGAADTFTVKLNTTAGGTFSGNISFANNTSTTNPYNFAIKGVVTGTAAAPEAEVLGNNVVITDGDTTPSTTDATDFGSIALGGAAPTKIFTVKNTGTANLTTSGLVLPSGFSIVEGLSATIAPGASDTFTVKLNTAAAGTFTGNISFANNDANENPYNFAVKGTVVGSSGSIAGTLFHDFDGDGAIDAGETPLGGWTVFLDTDKDGVLDAGETSATTSASGAYSFASLANNTYRVRPVLQSGWLGTVLGYSDVAVAGTSLTGKNLGVARPATISGNVFKDTNSNGFKDTGETALSAWKVFIDADNDGILDAGELTATTDASGNFSFTGLKPGTFNVRVQIGAGYVATSPTSASIAVRSGTTSSGNVFSAKTA